MEWFLNLENKEKNRFEIIKLFDIYKDLLTDKRKEYFISYYFEDQSYSELSVVYNVTRQAIQDNINNTIKDLYTLESKLKIYSKFNKINDLIDSITDENIINKLKKINQ